MKRSHRHCVEKAARRPHGPVSDRSAAAWLLVLLALTLGWSLRPSVSVAVRFPSSPTPRQQPARLPAPPPQARQTSIGAETGRTPQRPESRLVIPRFEPIFGPKWRSLPLDLTSYADGAEATPNYTPDRGVALNRYRRLVRLTGVSRLLSILYLIGYVLFLMPLFRLGSYRLTVFERGHRMDSILAGETIPFTLRRARRVYRSRSPKRWSPLAGLPPGAKVAFPSALGGARISGLIVERYEFIEPENMRQWRLYVLHAPFGAGPDCLLVSPARPGDWKRVEVRGGRVHCNLPVSQSPVGWPPASNLTILGVHGWPTEYTLKAATWPKPDLDPLSLEMNAAVRRVGDPPGRQYAPRPGAHWSYAAVPGQKHPPIHQFFDIFLIVNDIIVLETNQIEAKQVEFDLGEGRNALSLIVPEKYDL